MSNSNINIKENSENWSMIIKPKRHWFEINLKEHRNYRNLIALFVSRGFVVKYKQTILAPFWFIIQPLFTTIMFTIVFGNIAKLSTDGLPQILFYMSGIVGWNYFSSALRSTSKTFVANAGIFGKVYFPGLSLPISTIISGLIQFLKQFVFLLCFMIYYRIFGANFSPNLHSLLLSFLIILMAGLGLGFGIVISSMTTKYRDLTYLVGLAFGVLMFNKAEQSFIDTV